jgi:uncharacterized protein (TIGR03437 family)
VAVAIATVGANARNLQIVYTIIPTIDAMLRDDEQMFSSGRLSLLSIFVSVALTPCFAHSYGPPPRVTAAPGDNARACTQCHAGNLNSFSGSVNIVLQSGPVYIPGVKQRVMVQVADAAQQRWGFELSARLNSDPANGQAGELIPIDNFTQVICEDAGPKPCASGVSFIQHTSAGTRNGTKGGATFQFDWAPPSANVGPITLYVAGNAANGDGSSGGDHIYTSSVELSPAVSAAPSTSNVVSAATLAAGPMAPNSWVTVFGSNLSVTTRSWNDSDFTNGGLPVSLDGVGVVLTVFGAPRLAHVGYVSPTQVNFLLPSDAAASSYQVQVKNPAGISTQLPMTVQANAAQMFTWDGMHVAGTHADGSTLAPTTPAKPGETIVFFATGCGPTTQALIPGQIPTQANSLVTLPQVTIGGAQAMVMSAGVVPGNAGLYQVRVQVPANAANGDEAVVVQVCGVSSVPTLVTVQN